MTTTITKPRSGKAIKNLTQVSTEEQMTAKRELNRAIIEEAKQKAEAPKKERKTPAFDLSQLKKVELSPEEKTAFIQVEKAEAEKEKERTRTTNIAQVYGVIADNYSELTDGQPMPFFRLVSFAFKNYPSVVDTFIATTNDKGEELSPDARLQKMAQSMSGVLKHRTYAGTKDGITAPGKFLWFLGNQPKPITPKKEKPTAE